MAFVHLHTHSEYSLLDGAVSLHDLVERAAELGQNALALTDHGYMYGAASFYQTCMKHNAVCEKNIEHNERVKATGEGELQYPVQTVKPIIGCEVYFTPDSSLSKGGGYPELYHLILLAKNDTGYHNLMALCSDAAVRGYYYRPRITIEMLQEHHEGLIATSACIAGILARRVASGEYEDARHWAQVFIDIFGKDDYYVELQDQGITTRKDGVTQHQINIALNRLAKEMGLKTVGTNDIHYLNADDIETQDIMICIGNGDRLDDENRLSAYPETYMKSEEQMRKALAGFEDCIDTTQEVADKCNLTIEFGRIILPRFPLNEGETNESRLRDEAISGLKARYGDPLPERVIERFEHEYKIICDKGFPAYFLIVQEFARWAKENGIGVGPGRGSAAGSIISYALDITTFDPLELDLIFERFLSPERTEMPDIDMDFDDERREDVVQHCRDLYGEDKIAHVITFGTLKAKQAVVDAARVLDFSVGDGQRISKTLPTLGYTLKEALYGSKKNPIIPDFKKLYDEDPKSRKIIDAAMRIEGLTRGEGIHASAVIICRDAVQEYVPVKYDTKGGMVITQYDGVKTAELGLLKMDFLGLRTLTVISKTLENIRMTTGEKIDLDHISFTDPAIFDLFASGNTAGVFQVESDGMVSLLQRLKPDRYSDIVAVLALFRPGPLGAGIVDQFVARKNGREAIVPYDPRLEWIMEDTYGLMVYQEQVMRISMEMSGFSAGESDKLRKAVAKKKVKLMREEVYDWSDGTHETMEEHWLNGAVRRDYKREVAQHIWDDVLKFAEYAFNKSHSAAYAILTMQTAWLKAHYPHEFMAAVMTSYQGKTEQIIKYIASCKHSGIAILPPDINASRRDFTPTEEGVRFGFAGLKGVGESVADAIIEERERGGDFKSLYDYVDRVDSRQSNKRVVEALVKSGAFDSTGYTRRQLMLLVEENNLLDMAAKRQRDRASGQVSMFDLFESEDIGMADEIPPADGVEWDRRQKLAYEKDILGHYVSGHPLDPYDKLLGENSDGTLLSIDETDESGAPLHRDGAVITFSGMIANYAIKPTKKGTQWASFTLEDTEGAASCVMFGKSFESYRDYLEVDAVVKVQARLERSDRGTSLNVKSIERLKLAVEDVRPRALEISIPASSLDQYLVGRIVEVLERYPGADKVTLFVHQTDGSRYRMELPASVNSRSGGLVAEMQTVLGTDQVRSVML